MDLQQHHWRPQSRVIVTDSLSFGFGTSSTVQDGGTNGRFCAVLEKVTLLRTITVAAVKLCKYLRFLLINLREPSISTMYWLKGNTSTKVLLQSHFFGWFPNWFWAMHRSSTDNSFKLRAFWLSFSELWANRVRNACSLSDLASRQVLCTAGFDFFSKRLRKKSCLLKDGQIQLQLAKTCSLGWRIPLL